MGNREEKKFYITTAIDYVNGPPHIGHAVQKVWADVLARFHRAKGRRVWFLTGTDEHGVNVVRTAERLGKTPQELADENAVRFRGMQEALNLSWDDFIRTSDRARHWPGAVLMWRKLALRGDIYKKRYQGLYCSGHEAFVTAKDLVDGKCALHGREPELIDEENYFFRLSRYTDPIREVIENETMRVHPKGRKNEILALLHEGLEDVSFSRPAKSIASWGISVPDDPDQIQYVWCDALTNYLSAIGYGRNEEWQEWWPADLHVLGKDNLRFHAAIWPGMLMSACLPLPKMVFVHGFITVDGQKMSKTLGNVIDPFELVKQYDTDPVRYYFAKAVSTWEDGDFSHEKMVQLYNGDLANGLGNLVARVATLGEKVEDTTFDPTHDLDDVTRDICVKVREEYEAFMDDIRLHEAIAKVWTLVTFADRYINEAKPWAVPDEAEVRHVLVNLGYVISVITELIGPFLPDTAEKVRAQIFCDSSECVFKKGDSLFPRLEIKS